MSEVSADDKNIAVLTHVGGIFFGFVPSLIVWLLKKDENAFIGEQAREALNFQITVMIGFMIAGVLTFVLIGLLLLPLVWLANVVFSILAAVKTSQGEQYRYPVALRLIS